MIATPNEDNTFTLSVSLEDPVEAHGIWILADGDDSDSIFTTVIEKFEVKVEPTQLENGTSNAL